MDLLISQASDIALPCIWFTGPLQNDRVLYGYGIVRGMWFFRFTPFWPGYGRYIPGGILDSEGKYFSFEKLIGWTPKPLWVPNYLEWIFYLRRIFIKFDVEISPPKQLTIAEFKEMLVELTERELEPKPGNRSRIYKRVQSKFNEAKTFNDLVEFLNWYQKTDGGDTD